MDVRSMEVASYFNRFLTDLFQNWVILRERFSESDANPTNILTNLYGLIKI